MSRWARLVLWIVILVIVGASGWIVSPTGDDLGVWLLSVSVLLVAMVTLDFVAPTPARLLVERQGELGLTDLIFFVYPQPAPPDATQVPRDYLLQMHVAVTNIGGRKAVLSRLTIDHFVTESGRKLHLPEGVKGPISAHQWVQQRVSTNLFAGPPAPAAYQSAPPFTLDPDDVITLRFRMRRGIDWSDRWTLEGTKAFADDLADRFTGVEGTLVYRSGHRLITTSWSSPIEVAQQYLYRNLLKDFTSQFKEMPDIETQPISLE